MFLVWRSSIILCYLRRYSFLFILLFSLYVVDCSVKRSSHTVRCGRLSLSSDGSLFHGLCLAKIYIAGGHHLGLTGKILKRFSLIILALGALHNGCCCYCYCWHLVKVSCSEFLTLSGCGWANHSDSADDTYWFSEAVRSHNFVCFPNTRNSCIGFE